MLYYNYKKHLKKILKKFFFKKLDFKSINLNEKSRKL